QLPNYLRPITILLSHHFFTARSASFTGKRMSCRFHRSPDVSIRMRGAHKQSFILRRRQIDSAVEHGPVESSKGLCIGLRRRIPVGYLSRWKNHVSIDPTRFTVSATPCFLASASTPTARADDCFSSCW